MGTRHSLFLYCMFISNFISPFYCDDAYSYARAPDRPSVSGGRLRPRINNNRCSRIPIPNGSMVLKHRGRVAKFTCSSGYKLIGDNIATCHQRKWDAVPTCVKNVQCPKEIPKVMNGQMIEYSYVYFKVICNDGYKLPDSVQSIYPCEEFFRPDVEPPVCQLSDALYCDFEKDSCGWNNTIPYFSWIRYQNATPSHELHTGPGGDHTTGTGHYLYIEASGLPDHEERYAKLTRLFKQVDTPEVCFVFWYHMYGYNIGTLDVYVDFNKVFSKSGNLGDKWRKGIIQRLPSDREFYISVMATTANGFAGDIAIDDIGLVNSTDCTKTILIDATCKNRCFERELNSKLCKCSSECLIEGTCCTDFMHFCSNDAYTSTATAETTEWETTTEGWQISSNEDQQFDDVETAVDGRGSTEIYGGFTSDTNMLGDGVSEVSDSDDGLASELQKSTEGRRVEEFSALSESTSESDSTLLVSYGEWGKWSTQQEPFEGKTWSSIQQEPYVSGKSWSSTRQGLDDARNWTSIRPELHDVGNGLPSTQQELFDDARQKWSPAHPEWYSVSRSLPSTEQELLDVRQKWSPAHPEWHHGSKRLPLTQQDPTSSMQEHFTRATQVTASLRDPVNLTEQNPELSVSEVPSGNASEKEEESSVRALISKLETKPERNTHTTPIDADTEHNLSATHVQTTNPSVQATNLSLFVASTLVTSPLISLLQTSPPSPSVAPLVTNHQANPSSTASHTHLLPESDYDELDESTQNTEGPHRQTQLDLETTPPVELAGPQNTKKPYKWKKTYEPKGRYTFSAVQSENKTTTYVSVLIGVTAFLAAAVIAAYIFRRRRAIRFHDATEESDVLYMTSDEILDFNVARRQTPPSRGAPSHSAQPISSSTSSQQTSRMCQSDFTFSAFHKS